MDSAPRNSESRTAEEWTRIWEIYRTAAHLPPDERIPYVHASGASPEVMDQVLELLAGEETEPEPPQPGQEYGRYRLDRLLGTGGMGEVYAAYDSILSRQVALKFLGANARLMPTAMERLVREAQAASALNHPHLVTVYDVFECTAGTALVTELIEGKSLRALCGEPRPVREVAAWGAQIARGLAAAHAQGIVHGDIKPENVMVRADGYVKVLDFGLAQRDGRFGSLDGIALGTLGYMSPEQTRGEPLGGASDVFSLGVVLLELTSGTHPFRDTTAVATTFAINHRQPEILTPAGSGNSRMAELLRSMLSKQAARRPSAGQVAESLETIARQAIPRRRALLWALASAGLLALLATLAWWSTRDTVIRTGTPRTLTSYAGVESQPSFSPDGHKIAFVWSGPEDNNPDVYVRSVDGEDLRRLTTDPRTEFSPQWSPDGRTIAYLRRSPDGGASQVIVTPAAGGPERIISQVADSMGYRGMAWWPDSSSLVLRDAVGNGHPLVRIFVDRGRKLVLTESVGTQDFRPTLTPDGKSLAYFHVAKGLRSICRLELAGGPPYCMEWQSRFRSLAWHADSRHLLVSDNEGLWSLRLEYGRHSAAVRLQEGDFGDLATDRPVRRLAFSRNYIDINTWRLDTASGRASRFLVSSSEDSEAEHSPDGKHIVFRSDRGGNYELYIADADGSNIRQLTFLRGHCGSARWSPDGRWIAFDASDVPPPGTRYGDSAAAIYVVAAAGGTPRRLTTGNLDSVVPGWSADGQSIYFINDLGQHRNTWKIPLSGGERVLVSDDDMFDVTESGGMLYYGRPLSSRGLWRRAVAGGPEEHIPGTEEMVYRSWDLHGQTLFFLREGDHAGFVALDLHSGAARPLGPPPARIFHGPRVLSAAPDGKSILYLQQDLTLGDLMLLDLELVGAH